ncbi:hypothetical protein [Methanopyrus kandleri]
MIAEVAEFVLEALLVIGVSVFGLHLLGALASERIRCRAVPLVAVGLVHPHAALTTAREMGFKGRELIIAKVSFNSAIYTATACVNALTLLGSTVGGPYALTLALVDATETIVGGLLLRRVRAQLPTHGSLRDALNEATRTVGRIAAYLVPGALMGIILSSYLRGLGGYVVPMTFLANPVAGCAAVGTMLRSGVLDYAHAYSLAVTGAALAYVGRLLRSCGPVTVAITGIRSGSLLSTVNLLADIGLLLVYGVVIGYLTFGPPGVPPLGVLGGF